jgi:hypothetical protein
VRGRREGELAQVDRRVDLHPPLQLLPVRNREVDADRDLAGRVGGEGLLEDRAAVLGDAERDVIGGGGLLDQRPAQVQRAVGRHDDLRGPPAECEVLRRLVTVRVQPVHIGSRGHARVADLRVPGDLVERAVEHRAGPEVDLVAAVYLDRVHPDWGVVGIVAGADCL